MVGDVLLPRGDSVADHTGDPQHAQDTWVDEAMARLSTEQKAALLYGADPWQVRSPEPLHLHDLVMTDGPNGARGVTFHTGVSRCFPCETALAATWDPDLVVEVAAAIGAEGRSKGAAVLLAPAVNLHRNPLAGRNFECFSEDPELSAQMAAAYIAGVQSQGVACCVKHLVCNDQESGRHTASSEIGDAALRELYLTPFEVAARAGAWSVMAAYNKLNGEYVTEYPGCSPPSCATNGPGTALQSPTGTPPSPQRRPSRQAWTWRCPALLSCAATSSSRPSKPANSAVRTSTVRPAGCSACCTALSTDQ